MCKGVKVCIAYYSGSSDSATSIYNEPSALVESVISLAIIGIMPSSLEESMQSEVCIFFLHNGFCSTNLFILLLYLVVPIFSTYLHRVNLHVLRWNHDGLLLTPIAATIFHNCQRI